MTETLVMGAVAYSPQVVTIWEGFKAHFLAQGLDFDYVLFSNYERQVEAQFQGDIHLAWNSPLAWVRAERMARARGLSVSAVAMRDTDRDLRSMIVARAGSGIKTLDDLKGRALGVGAIDSPQATLLPLEFLARHGLSAGQDFTVQHFDVLGGKHGDHVGGERDAALALMRGDVDACCMIEGNLEVFAAEGTLPPGTAQPLADTDYYDHCNFTTSPGAPEPLVERFLEILLAMSWDDPAVCPLLKLEGLQRWLPGRTTGYAALERAVEQQGFYGPDGAILAAGYRY
ncbi:phosphate/phosphite/phosphonate ABC transporter substrate-binding protein [Methyloterricola oryzae]|uniref:phosphate/phosphite/phosphonate ABC transporter substrate-binding protein n=1 Tax=Methyloterricola oryzae TaxID=1495050 RepID=UPI0005EBACF0|nr:PhnD/SsuA/transferrin family substrate-binding protein [Methyloterricola oryzae]